MIILRSYSFFCTMEVIQKWNSNFCSEIVWKLAQNEGNSLCLKLTWKGLILGFEKLSKMIKKSSPKRILCDLELVQFSDFWYNCQRIFLKVNYALKIEAWLKFMHKTPPFTNPRKCKYLSWCSTLNCFVGVLCTKNKFKEVFISLVKFIKKSLIKSPKWKSDKQKPKFIRKMSLNL